MSTSGSTATVLAFTALFAAARTAGAQCYADTDCKGERICVSGVCQMPAHSGAPSPTRRGPETTYENAGWGQGASILGYVTAGGVLVLAIAAEATRTDQIPSIPLGVVATGAVAAIVPVVASSHHGSGGVLGMRIAGWIAYGLSLADAVALIGIGLANVTPPSGVITSVGLLGAFSLVAMAIDAGAAASTPASASIDLAPQAPRSAWTATPMVRLVRSANDHVGTVAGLSLAF